MIVRPVSLYIHVPFCKRRCPYCTFYHVPHVAEFEDAFVGALLNELKSAVDEIGEPVFYPTVFFGGGTPSVLGSASLDAIFEAISPGLPPNGAGEVTIEMNPEDVTDPLLARLKARGVNRISLGIQSMDAGSQLRLRRCAPDVNERALCRVARHFGNFNVDLLLGIPGASTETIRDTFGRIAAFDPKHFAVYCLEPGGVMDDDAAGFFRGIDDARAADEYLTACDILAQRGYEHYELSNFARPGFECRHNLVYWSGREYLGLGPGAHSYVGGERFFNEPSVEHYVTGGGKALSKIRRFDGRQAEEVRMEALMLGLRTSAGLPLGEIGGDRSLLAGLVGAGLASISRDRLVLSDRGFLVLDEILLKLTAAGETSSAALPYPQPAPDGGRAWGWVPGRSDPPSPFGAP